jgi:purine-binding chemotaxis protein CheW
MATTGSAPGREFLSFRLGSEEYGVEILRVQEIRSYESVTRIANSPEYVKGVLNLRGIIVPIVDLRIKFRLASVEYNQFTVVIILNVAGRVVGMVVDSVSDVLLLGSDQIRPVPDLNAQLDTAFIEGVGTTDGRMLILLEVDKLIGGVETPPAEPTPLQ